MSRLPPGAYTDRQGGATWSQGPATGPEALFGELGILQPRLSATFLFVWVITPHHWDGAEKNPQTNKTNIKIAISVNVSKLSAYTFTCNILLILHWGSALSFIGQIAIIPLNETNGGVSLGLEKIGPSEDAQKYI